MSETTFLELKTHAVLGSIRVINELLDVALRELKVGDALRHDVALGVAELVANVHRHEYQGRPDGEVVVRLDVQPRLLQVTIESQGPRFDPTEAPTEAPDHDELPELEAGGLGLPLLHGLFDEVKFDYEEGKGNRVLLKKTR